MTSFQWISLVFLVAIINEVFSTVSLEVPSDVMKDTEPKYPISGTIFEFRIAAVSDLENKSKSQLGTNVWLTYLKKGCLIYNNDSQKITVKWDSGLEKGEIHYTKNSTVDGRAFGMSEMVIFHEQLLAADDETGILYKYQKGEFVYWQIVPENDEGLGTLRQLPSEHGQGEEGNKTPKANQETPSENKASPASGKPDGQAVLTANQETPSVNKASPDSGKPDGQAVSTGSTDQGTSENPTVGAKTLNKSGSKKLQRSSRWERINLNDTPSKDKASPASGKPDGQAVSTETVSKKGEESKREEKITSGNIEATSAVVSKDKSSASPEQQNNNHGSHKPRKIVAMNIEWATVKDGSLFVGPNGVGKSKFVAIIDRNKKITFEDWSKHFEKMQNVAGIKEGGYMTFESCEWSKLHKKYFFLPKTASNDAYDRFKDPGHGTNLIMSASSDFADVKKEGDITEVHTDRGYSSFKFLPHTKDQVIVALQTSEITNETHIIAFTTNGRVIHRSSKVADIKFEGLAFL